MKVIGLTGGVGSGKSVVAHILEEEYHAQLLITDELGHRVIEPGTEGYQKVVSAFGEKVVNEDGTIDRNRLAACVFQNEEARQRLNGIIHPLVIAYIERYIAERKAEEGIIVLESALLFESGCDRLCDSVWYVHVSYETREDRLMRGRGYTKEKTKSIVKRQLSEENFLQMSDVVINNDGSEEELREIVCQTMNVSSFNGKTSLAVPD